MKNMVCVVSAQVASSLHMPYEAPLTEPPNVSCARILGCKLWPLDEEVVRHVEQETAAERERLYTTDGLNINDGDGLDSKEPEANRSSADRHASAWAIGEKQRRPVPKHHHGSPQARIQCGEEGRQERLTHLSATR